MSTKTSRRRAKRRTSPHPRNRRFFSMAPAAAASPRAARCNTSRWVKRRYRVQPSCTSSRAGSRTREKRRRHLYIRIHLVSEHRLVLVRIGAEHVEIRPAFLHQCRRRIVRFGFAQPQKDKGAAIGRAQLPANQRVRSIRSPRSRPLWTSITRSSPVLRATRRYQVRDVARILRHAECRDRISLAVRRELRGINKNSFGAIRSIAHVKCAVVLARRGFVIKIASGDLSGVRNVGIRVAQFFEALQQFSTRSQPVQVGTCIARLRLHPGFKLRAFRVFHPAVRVADFPAEIVIGEITDFRRWRRARIGGAKAIAPLQQGTRETSRGLRRDYS